MPRNEVIEFKVTVEEKAQIRSEAKRRGMTTGGFVRAAGLRELSKKEEAQVSRAEPEDDGTNKELGEGACDEEDWIKRRALQLTARMGSRKARLEAQKEWEEMVRFLRGS